MDVKERFLKYVSYDTSSDENSLTVPSTAKQRILGEYLAKELKQIGLTEVVLDEYGYVYGFLPATKGCESEGLGFIAHMDTSPDVSGANVNPRIIEYTGGDIQLGENVCMTAKEFPVLCELTGKELIVTDGTTLLGADDKAGIAEIFTACEYFISNPEIPHKAISVCITPDEEIGRGVDKFDFSRFGAKVAYTVDGGELGEIEYENFNGAFAKITVNGINIHPGSAKNKMKNAILMANEFISMMPKAETPAHTEGYEGFYHITDINGNETKTEIYMIIRDHDRAKFENRKKFINNLTEYMNSVYGEKTFVSEMKDSYYNMKEKILPHIYLIDNAKKAMEKVGVEPKVVAIRGGTDGARLSYEGLPCPNLSTGGINFHSIHELIPVDSLNKMVNVLIELAKM